MNLQASGHVAPVRPPLERSTEPLDLDISSRPLDWYVQPGQGLGAVGQAAGVATGTGIAAPEDVAPVPNPGEPRGKVHKKTSHKKKVQWDRVPAGEADLGSAEAKEPGPEDLQKEGTRGEQRQAEEAAEGPRGSDEKQCAACGVTQSRRWYGASAGACKCSKCYDREYDMKKRAREGNGPEEAVVLTKGRKRQRKESSTVKAGGGTAVAALALAGPEVQFEGATGTGGSVMKADGGNEVKTGARVKETPKKWKGSLEKKGKQSVPMGAEERGGKVGTKGDFEKAPKEKTGGAEATGKQVARFGAAYERENVKRRRSIEGTAEEKTGGAEEEGNQLVRPGAEERGGEIETKGHFERARKRRIGDTEGQGIPAVERGAAYDQDKAKARGRSEGAAKEKTGGSEEEEERVGKEGAGGEKAGDDIGAEGAAAAVTKGANDGAAKLDSERVGGEEEKAASDGGMGRAERWGNDRAMEGGGKKETAKVNSGAQKGNDAERGEEGAPGTESGDPPAKRGVQGFVGEILRVMSETGAEAAEPDEARVVLEADKGGKENENGVFRGAAAAEVGKTREAAEAEEGAGTETAGTAVGPGKETGLGGLVSG